MNRKEYDKAMYDILEHNSKLKKIKKYPTLSKEGQLQRFIRSLKKQSVFDVFYFGGSQLSRLYGTHKLYKSFTNAPLLRPIVSFINRFDYDPAKYLWKLLQRIPSMHVIHKILNSSNNWKVGDHKNFLISFDVYSLSTNIPLNETTELALDYILSNLLKNVNISRKDFQNFFQFPKSETHFYFNGDIYE